MAQSFGPLLIGAGLVELATLVLFYFCENSRDRLNYLRVLASMLMFDALVTHMPISELDRSYGKAISQCTFDLAILGGLYMLSSQKDDSEHQRQRRN